MCGRAPRKTVYIKSDSQPAALVPNLDTQEGREQHMLTIYGPRMQAVIDGIRKKQAAGK